MSTEVETLKAELEHERSLRALDAKRFQKEKQRLERQVEFAVEEAQEAKSLMEEEKLESERHIAQLKKARSRAQEELRDTQMQLEEERAVASTNDLDNEDDPRLRQLQEELDAKTVENESLHQAYQELRQDFKNLQEQQENASKTAKSGDDNIVSGSSEARPEVLRELNRVRIQLAETERKNRQLRRTAEELQKKAKQLIHERESARSANHRVQSLELELKEMSQNQATAQANLNSWKEFGSTLCSLLQMPSPNADAPPESASVKRYLNQATRRSQELDTENQQLRSQLEKADDMKRKLESAVRELEGKETSWITERGQLDKKIELKEQDIQLLQRQEGIWKREVESCRSIIKTFDELPLPGKEYGGASSINAQAIQASLDAAKEELVALKEAHGKLKEELDNVMKAKSQVQAKHNTVLEKFGKLREAVYEERAKSEKAEARAVRAEQLSGKGAFDPETTRVLHLKHNPVTEALKQEVNVLKRQLEALTAGGKQTVPLGSDVDPNKLHQRLKESFKEQIGRFREGVYLLTGFKIDMIPENDRPRFKVRSMFAEREDDHLMFKWPEGDDVAGLDLLNTELAKVLMTTPSHEYISRFHSMPAFLSSVQLSLFEKQTMM